MWATKSSKKLFILFLLLASMNTYISLFTFLYEMNQDETILHDTLPDKTNLDEKI